jgi:hypothetical protein
MNARYENLCHHLAAFIAQPRRMGIREAEGSALHRPDRSAHSQFAALASRLSELKSSFISRSWYALMASAS